MNHLVSEQVDRWLSNLANDQENLNSLRHLLGCAGCAARVQAKLMVPASSPQAGSEIDYSQVWTRLLGNARSAEVRARRVRAKSALLIEELLASPPDRRIERLKSDRRLAHRVFAEQALAAIRSRPERAEDLARIALAVVERLPNHQKLAAARTSLLASARCHLAEVFRSQGLFNLAEIELEKVALLSDLSDALERAQYCRVLGAVRRDRGRLDEALALFARAAELYGDLGEIDHWVDAQLAIGGLHLEVLDARRAKAVFGEILSTSDSMSASQVVRAVQGRVLALLWADGPEVALRTLKQVSTTCPWTSESVEAHMLLALRGRIELGVGNASAARQALTQALQGLMRCGAVLEAALTGAALSLLYFRAQSSTEERLELARALDMLSTADVPFKVECSLIALRDGLRRGYLAPPKIKSILAAIECYWGVDSSRYSPHRISVIH